MASIRIKPTSHNRITLERTEAGEVVSRYTSTFANNRDFAKAAREMGCDPSQIMPSIVASQDDGQAREVGLEIETPITEFYIRSRLQTNRDSIPFDSFDEALAYTLFPHPEPLIYWDGTDDIAALDIDYHNLAERYSIDTLEQLAARIEPKPSYLWVTHGRGLRMVYRASGIYKAGELASVAGICYGNLDPLSTYEVKAITRHPAYAVGERQCGPIRRCVQTSETSILGKLFGTGGATADEINRYLDTHGYVIGERYEHDKCPVNPDDKKEKRKPVIVRDDGIYCHLCSANGKAFGSRMPGWFTYDALLGRTVPTMIGRCVRNFTHWEHARYVWAETLGMSENASRQAYSAALKAVHGDDSRITGVFTQGENFVRFTGRWGNTIGESYNDKIEPILMRLPACQYVDGGELKIDPEKVTRLNQHMDLTRYGYPALTPIFGLRIYSHRLPLRDANQISMVIQTGPLASDGMAQFRPKYVKGDVDEAWELIEEVCPGVNRNAIKLLIAAKGCCEGNISMPPMIFISGPTSSAKSSSVVLAATICGDVNSSIQWVTSTERVRQSVMDGKESGTFLTFNEILKERGSNGSLVDVRTKLDLILNLTPDSRSHKMYVGSAKLGALPVICFTDTCVPIAIKTDAQLSRRLTHIPLVRQVDWETSLRETGVNKVEFIRTADAKYAHACNVIVSSVIDEFFTEPITFGEIAEQLGFTALANSEEAKEGAWVLQELFKVACGYPDVNGSDATRWKGRGWKLIVSGQETQLCDLWRQVADGDSGPQWGESRRCTEVDWGKLLGSPYPIKFESRCHGSKVVIRWIHRESRTEYKVNGELV